MPAVIGRIIRAPSNIARFLLLQLEAAPELQWTIKEGATPIENVKTWLSTGSPYTSQNLVAIKVSNGSGVVTYTLLADTVYYGWRNHSVYTFTDPIQFRYSSADARWELWNGDEYVEWTP